MGSEKLPGDQMQTKVKPTAYRKANSAVFLSSSPIRTITVGSGFSPDLLTLKR